MEEAPFKHLRSISDHHILIGPRGSGKTALMLAVCDFLKENVLNFIFPLELRLRDLDPTDFLKELVIGLLNKLFRELRNHLGNKFDRIESKILNEAKWALYDLLPAPEKVESLFDFLRVLRIESKKIRELSGGEKGGKLDLKFLSVGGQKSEEKEVISTVTLGLGFPTRFFNEIISEISKETKLPIYIFIDDLDLVARLSPEKQSILFDFLRNTKGKGVTFTVAVCPPGYYCGVDFDVRRDATEVRLIRDELEEQQYLDFFERLMLARIEHIGRTKPPDLNAIFTEGAFRLAAFGAMGNPSDFLDICRNVAEKAIEKGKENITADEVQDALIDWTRTVEIQLLQFNPFERAIFQNFKDIISNFNAKKKQESSIHFSLPTELIEQDEINALLNHLIFHRVLYLRNPARKMRKFTGKQYGYNFGMAVGSNLISRANAIQTTSMLKENERLRTIEISRKRLLEGTQLLTRTDEEIIERDEVARIIEMFQEVDGIGPAIAKNIVHAGFHTFEDFLQQQNEELVRKIPRIGRKNIITIRHSMTALNEWRLQQAAAKEN